MNNMFVGLDIGGSRSKLSLLSLNHFELNNFQHVQVLLNEQKYHLYCKAFEAVHDALQYLQKKVKPIGNIKIGVTGGGAVKYQMQIGKIFDKNSIFSLNQFESSVMGMEFVRKTNLPLKAFHFQSKEIGQIYEEKTVCILDQFKLPILFVSLGSGVNYQKYDLGANGLERIKASDPSTAEDGAYFLTGSSLGGGFLVGIGKLLAEINNPVELFEASKKSEEIAEAIRLIFTNITQTALNMSILHETPTIIFGGSILHIKSNINVEFADAVKLLRYSHPLKKTIATVENLQGYQGCLGAIIKALTTQDK